MDQIVLFSLTNYDYKIHFGLSVHPKSFIKIPMAQRLDQGMDNTRVMGLLPGVGGRSDKQCISALCCMSLRQKHLLNVKKIP